MFILRAFIYYDEYLKLILPCYCDFKFPVLSILSIYLILIKSSSIHVSLIRIK